MRARLELLDDVGAIAACALRDPHLHHFALADLDPPYPQRTTFYGWCAGGSIEQLALVYDAPGGRTSG